MSPIGIMQPYFFPYLGYFQLISATKEWIVFDTPQYIRHGWINRNRILKSDGNDWQYINVPLKKHIREIAIKEVEILEGEWRAKIMAQLVQYKKKAPYYSKVIDVVKQSMSIETNSIVNLNINSLKTVCNYLNIQFNYKVYSEMNLQHPVPQHAGEWALYISNAIDAKTYINPPSGREIFDKEQFKNFGITILFLEPILSEYDQKNTNFIGGLSIIDVMMFNKPEEISQMLNNYKLR